MSRVRYDEAWGWHVGPTFRAKWARASGAVPGGLQEGDTLDELTGGLREVAETPTWVTDVGNEFYGPPDLLVSSSARHLDEGDNVPVATMSTSTTYMGTCATPALPLDRGVCVWKGIVRDRSLGSRQVGEGGV